MKFTDDQGMMAQSESGIQTIINALSKARKKYNMKINAKKAKVMGVCRDGSKREKRGNAINLTIDGRVVEQVNQFRYLGTLISDDWTCAAEFKSRIAIAKYAFNKKENSFKKNEQIPAEEGYKDYSQEHSFAWIENCFIK